jgi:cytochrome c oxidase cbb3-type subunit 3
MRSCAAVMAVLVTASACRDDDTTQLLPSSGATQQAVPVRTSDLRAGGVTRDVAARNPYEGDAEALSTGRQLYASMNCAGCHGPAGGGGIGPPFADTEWIYGSEPENIVQSVLQGRPNGMPSFAGKLPPSEVWKLAAFVDELAKAGQAASGRDPRMPTVSGGAKRAETRQ